MKKDIIIIMNKELLLCPECYSHGVVTTQEQMIMANTDEHYCFSVKNYDADSKAECLDCSWKGTRCNLIKRKTI